MLAKVCTMHGSCTRVDPTLSASCPLQQMLQKKVLNQKELFWYVQAMVGHGDGRAGRPMGRECEHLDAAAWSTKLGVIIKAKRNCRQRMPTTCLCYPTTFLARACRRVPAEFHNQVNNLGVHNHGMRFKLHFLS